MPKAGAKRPRSPSKSDSAAADAAEDVGRGNVQDLWCPRISIRSAIRGMCTDLGPSLRHQTDVCALLSVLSGDLVARAERVADMYVGLSKSERDGEKGKKLRAQVRGARGTRDAAQVRGAWEERAGSVQFDVLAKREEEVSDARVLLTEATYDSTEPHVRRLDAALEDAKLFARAVRTVEHAYETMEVASERLKAGKRARISKDAALTPTQIVVRIASSSHHHHPSHSSSAGQGGRSRGSGSGAGSGSSSSSSGGSGSHRAAGGASSSSSSGRPSSASHKKKLLTSARAAGGPASSAASSPPRQPRGSMRLPDTPLSRDDLDDGDGAEDSEEPTYCLCHQVAFGEMIACDAPDCPIEWFHCACVGIAPGQRPQGRWICPVCSKKQADKHPSHPL